MAVASVASGTGSQLTVINTEHDLLTAANMITNGAGVYVLMVDLGPMANGDVVELRVYSRINTSLGEKLAYYAVYANVQGQPNKYSTPIPSMAAVGTDSLHFTLKQTAGTVRTFFYRTVTVG